MPCAPRVHLTPTAVSPAVGSSICILFVELVSVLAVRLAAVCATHVAAARGSSNILEASHRLKVTVVDAPSVVAGVIQFHAGRNRTDERLVDDAVNLGAATRSV
jgi:hypothetical protein